MMLSLLVIVAAFGVLALLVIVAGFWRAAIRSANVQAWIEEALAEMFLREAREHPKFQVETGRPAYTDDLVIEGATLIVKRRCKNARFAAPADTEARVRLALARMTEALEGGPLIV